MGLLRAHRSLACVFPRSGALVGLPFLRLEPLLSNGSIGVFARASCSTATDSNGDENDESRLERLARVLGLGHGDSAAPDNEPPSGALAPTSGRRVHQKSRGRGFVDSMRLKAKGGSGGDGCVSFGISGGRRYGAKKPDGGGGGHGGDVFLVASRDEQSLYFVPHHASGGDGQHGEGGRRSGKSGKNSDVRVPVGTVVNKVLRHDTHEVVEQVHDLSRDGDRILVARGGRGGRGNAGAAGRGGSRSAVRGAPGELVHLWLEMKTIADVGFLGMPNAGKSSLLRCISRAKPKAAPYAFTTLAPSIGVMERNGYERIRVADLPGIIQGASSDRGLGLAFLRHAERSRALAIVVDVSSVSKRDPVRDLQVVVEEVQLFRQHMLQRAKIVVLNKMDLPGAAEGASAVERYLRTPEAGALRHAAVSRVSAETLEGVDDFIDTLFSAAPPEDLFASQNEDSKESIRPPSA